ncbi:colanic acid exporter [Tatumella sp. TA1]|nr:colanic acid exporter [Tatumella sp. TA1]
MSLKEKTIAAVKWNLLSTIVVNFMGIFSLWILSHLLSTTDYGIMSYALIITTFVMLLLDFGISNSVVRSKEVTVDELSTLYTINIVLGFLAFILIFVSSSFISSFFNGGVQLSHQVKIISFGFLFLSFGLQPKALLTKEMLFSAISKITIITNISNYIVVLSLCYIFRNPWCIAAGFVFSMLVSSLLSVFYAKKHEVHVFKFTFKLNSIKNHFRYGVQLVMDSIVNQININTYPVLMSRLVNISAIGGYNLAYSISIALFEKLNPVLSHTLFPAFSQISSSEDKLRNVFLKVTTFSALINFPILFGMFIISDDVILSFFDPKWFFIIPMIKILSITGAIRSLDTPVISILLVRAKMYLNVRLGVFKILLGIPLSYLLGVKYGILGICFSFLIIQSINTVLGYFFLLKKSIRVPLRNYLSSVFIPLFNVAPMLIIGLFIKYNLFFLSEKIRLVVIIISCVIVYSITLFISRNVTVIEFRKIITSNVLKVLK